jgi:hypothetical protein
LLPTRSSICVHWVSCNILTHIASLASCLLLCRYLAILLLYLCRCCDCSTACCINYIILLLLLLVRCVVLLHLALLALLLDGAMPRLGPPVSLCTQPQLK